jgi:hypothetical protein
MLYINNQKIAKPYFNGQKYNAYLNGQKLWMLFPQFGSITHLLYVDETFFAYDSNGNVAFSTDGTNWTITKTNMKFSNVIYDNGKFIAFNSSEVGYSTDGINWTVTNLSRTGMRFDLVYGNGVYIAVGNNIGLDYSFDGITWNHVENPNGGIFVNSIAYGAGIFVAVDEYNDSVRYSATPYDLSSWNTVYFQNNFFKIKYLNNQFIALANKNNSNKIGFSNDGINWTQIDVQNNSLIQDIIYVNGNYILLDYDGGITSSTNLVNWQYTTTITGNKKWYSIINENNKYVATGNKCIAYSVDVINWTTIV